MLDKKDKVIPFIIVFSIITLFVTFRDAFLPFVFAFIIAALLRKLVKVIENMTGLNSRISGVVTLILCYAILCFLCYVVLKSVFAEVGKLSNILPNLYDGIVSPFIKEIEDYLLSKMGTSVNDLFLYLFEFIKKQSAEFLNKLSVSLANIVTNLILEIPGIITSITVSIIASFFICLDYEKITNHIWKKIPARYVCTVDNIKSVFVKSVYKICYSYFLIFVITFLELVIGLYLLKVEYVFVVSFFIALADLLPIIGTATILVPWTLISFVKGNIPFAVGLMAMCLIILIVRNIIEPKILGKTIGVHPLVTLMVMYIGFNIGGFVGAIITPVIFTLVKNLFDNRKLCKITR